MPIYHLRTNDPYINVEAVVRFDLFETFNVTIERQMPMVFKASELDDPETIKRMIKRYGETTIIHLVSTLENDFNLQLGKSKTAQDLRSKIKSRIDKQSVMRRTTGFRNRKFVSQTRVRRDLRRRRLSQW